MPEAHLGKHQNAIQGGRWQEAQTEEASVRPLELMSEDVRGSRQGEMQKVLLEGIH